ncbi:MAG: 5'-nucleotidase C-terminal domain-containing protein [Bacteroidales bacterium]|nr:5'-nucleotidase C-terminal domain-containing protein [Bacteroidales bacterium]
MKHRIAVLLTILILCAFSCEKVDTPVKEDPVEQPDGKPKAGIYTLPIIETTDCHGYIVTVADKTVHYRMAFIADKAKDIRGNDRSRLLLLDGGDIYQGNSVSNLMDGKPMYMSMDKMGYDAVALGNHEFDWDFETMADPDATLLDYDWDGTHKDNYVPIVCANLYRDGERVSCTKDYIIVEKTAVNSKGGTVNVKIGIVGFVPDYSGSIMTSKFAGKGYSIKEDYSIANNIAKELEESGQCDATILLIHGAADEAAERIGKNSVFDFVLGGHTHQTIGGRTGWGLPYLQGGRYCEHYAYADMNFTVDEEGAVSFSKVDKMKFCPVDTSRDLHSYETQNVEDLDPDILEISYYAIATTSQQLNDVIGYINVNATNYGIIGSGDRSTIMSNWMCDIIRRIGEADVSFVNSGGVRTSFPLNGMSQRNITVSNVFEIFPFGNTTYIYRITYADLLELFKYAMTSGGGSLFSYMTGINCYYTGSNGSYSVKSLRKDDGTLIYHNGNWTEDWASRELTLAVSEYLATTERTDYYTGRDNPLLQWNETDFLVNSDLVDNENAIRVLRAEAAASGGLLSIDTSAHFILL